MGFVKGFFIFLSSGMRRTDTGAGAGESSLNGRRHADALQSTAVERDATNLADACEGRLHPGTDNRQPLSLTSLSSPWYDCQSSELFTPSFLHCIATKTLLRTSHIAPKTLNVPIFFRKRENGTLFERKIAENHSESRDNGAETSHPGVCQDAADSWVWFPRSAVSKPDDSELIYP